MSRKKVHAWLTSKSEKGGLGRVRAGKMGLFSRIVALCEGGHERMDDVVMVVDHHLHFLKIDSG